MKAISAPQKQSEPSKAPKRSRNKVTELSIYLAECERQRQSLVHSLKGKFSNMKFSSEDLIKQRRAETLLEDR